MTKLVQLDSARLEIVATGANILEILKDSGYIGCSMFIVGTQVIVRAKGDPLLGCATVDALKARLARELGKPSFNHVTLIDYDYPPCVIDPQTIDHAPRILFEWRAA